jgi:hypothetical protein
VAHPAGSPHRRARAAPDRHARGRQCRPPALHRRLQSALRPAAGRSDTRLAPPAPRPPAGAELSLHPDRGARQYRPAWPPLAAAPGRLRRPLAGGLPRRVARVPGWPPGRPVRGPGPRRAAVTGPRVRAATPRRPDGRAPATPTRLQEPFRGGGPLSPPWPKSRPVTALGTHRAGPGRAPLIPPTSLAARVLCSGTGASTRPHPSRGMTFSRGS